MKEEEGVRADGRADGRTREERRLEGGLEEAVRPVFSVTTEAAL